MGGPDGQIEAPGDAARGGTPERFGINVEGKFIETDVAAVGAECVRIGTERENSGAVVEFDVADFEVFHEASVPAVLEDWCSEAVDAVGEDGFGLVIENVCCCQ